MRRTIMSGVVCALSVAAGGVASGQSSLWGIGNFSGDLLEEQLLFGLTPTIDFDAGTGSITIDSVIEVFDANGVRTTTRDPVTGEAWNPGLGLVNGRIYASNQFNTDTPDLLTGEIDPATGVYRGINDQGLTDPNPIPGLGPVTSDLPRSNGLVGSFAGNPPGEGNQNLVLGITQDAIQYGFNADTENPIGNIGPAPLGFDPVEDVEGLATDAANDIVYVVDDRVGDVPVLLEAEDPSGPGLTITETPLTFVSPTLFDNFGLTFDPFNDALILSATGSDAAGFPLTEFWAINPDDPTDVVSLGLPLGGPGPLVQIGGLAAIPAPGSAVLLGVAGVAGLRRRR